jgi:hypothetical protein
MSASHFGSPIVVDGILSDEKLAELLAFQTEYPDLDYKRTIDLTTTEGVVELAKDVGAMQVKGGYIIGGVDNEGALTGGLDGADLRPFDEARLVPKLLRYLPEPLELRTRVTDRGGHQVVVIYVGRHPSGCAIFRADGQYEKDGGLVVAFRSGDVFWRDGTRSVRLTQQGFEELIERRIADAKALWLEEQHEIRRRERAELRASRESREAVTASLGAVSFDLEPAALNLAALELVRAGDDIALRYLLNQALTRARGAIDRNELDSELRDVVDKLTCLGATFLAYEQRELFARIVSALAAIYSLPLEGDDARRFGLSSRIDPEEKAPRVWLLVIVNVYGLGALAVRLGDWEAVRELSLVRPNRLDDYDANWLRHALTMASRAQHLQEDRDDQTVELSLLSLARNEIDRLECLRLDGLAGDDDQLITSLAQFDVLSNLAAIDGSGEADGRVFYTNFARFRQDRIMPILELLLKDQDVRKAVFKRSDEDLAIALTTIARMAHNEGVRYDGFWGFDRTPIGAFIAEHSPQG